MKPSGTRGRALIAFMVLSAMPLVPLPSLASRAPAQSRSQDRAHLTRGGEKAAAVGLLFRWDYLRREDATQREDYTRISLACETESRLLHPRAGVEMRKDDSQLRAYFFGDDIEVTRHSRLNLRLNHTEFGDWKSAINYINAYYSYQRWWVRLAAGWGYAALIFAEKDYQNPFQYESEAPQTRFIYNVSLRPSLCKGRVELELGFKNFDNFEYHGFDDNGFHIEPIFHISEHTTISYFYERRYAGAFISVPTLTRTSWMVSVQHSFN